MSGNSSMCFRGQKKKAHLQVVDLDELEEVVAAVRAGEHVSDAGDEELAAVLSLFFQGGEERGGGNERNIFFLAPDVLFRSISHPSPLSLSLSHTRP